MKITESVNFIIYLLLSFLKPLTCVQNVSAPFRTHCKKIPNLHNEIMMDCTNTYYRKSFAVPCA